MPSKPFGSWKRTAFIEVSFHIGDVATLVRSLISPMGIGRGFTQATNGTSPNRQLSCKTVEDATARLPNRCDVNAVSAVSSVGHAPSYLQLSDARRPCRCRSSPSPAFFSMVSRSESLHGGMTAVSGCATGASARSLPWASTARARWWRAGRTLLGWSIGWLPDGRMLITGEELVRVEPDGSRVSHADLGHISPYGWNEITVDGRGNVYINTINFDFADFNDVLTTGKAPGKIALVTPDGEAREVASEIAFPNGMVVTPDNTTLIVAESFAQRLTAFDIASDGSLSNRRTWAEPVGPDGICLDADGCVWASSGAMTNDCARIREGGEVLERIDLDRSCFATHARRTRPAHAVHARRGLARARECRRRDRGQNRTGARRRRSRIGGRLAVGTRPRYPGFWGGAPAAAAPWRTSRAVSGGT